MSKLSTIVARLSDKDVESIYQSLINTDATKSAELLKFLRQNKHSDIKIQKLLDVNKNAFYTLRSRLNDRIENYFLQEMETPKTKLLKQVAGINDILFSKNKSIAITSLKKLEKELKSYDLSNELNIVYKTLKRMHFNSPDYFEYSQAYNKNLSYVVALDKAEELVYNYFKRFNETSTDYLNKNSFTLEIIRDEIENIANLYKSHRLTTYSNIVGIFHKIWSLDDVALTNQSKEIEAQINQCKDTLATYSQDVYYSNLRFVFHFLEIYLMFKIKRHDKTDRLLSDITENNPIMMFHYSLVMPPSVYMYLRLNRSCKRGVQGFLESGNDILFEEMDFDENDVINSAYYYAYRSVCNYYAMQHQHAVRWIQNINELPVIIKSNRNFYIDLKLIECFMYLQAGMNNEAIEVLNYTQRQIRIHEQAVHPHSYAFMKIIRSYYSDIEDVKKNIKIQKTFEAYQSTQAPEGSPLSYLFIDPTSFQKKSRKVNISRKK